MTDDTDLKSRITGWGFLAMVAEAWPLLLIGPVVLALLAYFLVSTPVQFETTASLPVPYSELTKVSLPRAVDAALLEAGLDVDRTQILALLSTSPVAGNTERSMLRLRYTEQQSGEQPYDRQALLQRITEAVMEPASLTYAEIARELMREDIVSIQGQIATLEQASTNMELALSETDAVAEDIGGLAEATVALVEISKYIQALRLAQRSLRQKLVKFDEELAKPIPVRTEQVSGPTPGRTALLVAVGAEVLLLVLIIIRDKVRRLTSAEANAPEIARIRRAFGLARRGG